jgi:hypothetical protein
MYYPALGHHRAHIPATTSHILMASVMEKKTMKFSLFLFLGTHIGVRTPFYHNLFQRLQLRMQPEDGRIVPDAEL